MTLPVYPNKIFGIDPDVLKTPEIPNMLQAGVDPASVLTIPQVRNPVWHFQLSYFQLFNDPGGNADFKNPNYSATELQTLMGFFLAQAAQNGAFLFDDTEDDAVANGVLPLVNDGASPPAWYSPIQRVLGDPGVAQFSEDVTDLNPQSGSGLALKVNGNAASAANGDFSLLGPGLTLPGSSYLGLYGKWRVWTANAPMNLGNLLIDPAGHLQKITTNGALGSSMPAFNDSGSTTTDGTAVWTDQGIASVTASFSFYFRVRFEDAKLDFERFLQHLYTIGGAEGKAGSGYVKLMTRRPAGI